MKHQQCKKDERRHGKRADHAVGPDDGALFLGRRQQSLKWMRLVENGLLGLSERVVD
jgi:hypothetical protein